MMSRRFTVLPGMRWGLTALACLSSAGVPAASADEVRGTWMTTSGNTAIIRDGRYTDSNYRKLRDIGLNTAYIESWKNGYTQYPSATLQSLIGQSKSPWLGTRDLLQENITHAHRQGMQAVAWFEYGFAVEFIGASETQALSPLGRLAQNNGWLLKDQSGNIATSAQGFAWMNPAVPAVRKLLIDLVIEAATKYDLDGIQFDDRLAWPVAFGFDSTTAARYLADTGRSLPTTTTNTHFNNWRSSQVTLFATELNAALAAARPDVRVSVSPSVNGFSQSNYLADWPTWISTGLFNEAVPQVYRSTLSSFNSTLPSNVSPFTNANRADDGIIGIRSNGSGGDTPIADVLAMIQSTRSAANGQLAGHAIWYSDNVLDFATQLTSFYDGYVPSPVADPNRRTGSTDATPNANLTQWTVTLADEGQYRLAVGGDPAAGSTLGVLWRELSPQYFRAGTHTITLPASTFTGYPRPQLELIRDRRPLQGDFDASTRYDAGDLDALMGFIAESNTAGDVNGDNALTLADRDAWLARALTTPGDVNLDGVVNLADFNILRNAFTGHRDANAGPRLSWALGNFDGDADIDFADVATLRRFYIGDAASFDAALATLVPEPAALMLGCPLVCFIAHRRPSRCDRSRNS